MSITVSVTNWLVSNATYGIHLKMVIWKFECILLVPPNLFFFLVLDFNPDFVLCRVCSDLSQGNNQRTLAFDKESVFSLSDCPDKDGFIVNIEKTRWIRRSKIFTHLLIFKANSKTLWMSFLIPLSDEVVGSVRLGAESGDEDGRQHWIQALQFPDTPCVKWYPMKQASGKAHKACEEKELQKKGRISQSEQ